MRRRSAEMYAIYSLTLIIEETDFITLETSVLSISKPII